MKSSFFAMVDVNHKCSVVLKHEFYCLSLVAFDCIEELFWERTRKWFLNLLLSGTFLSLILRSHPFCGIDCEIWRYRQLLNSSSNFLNLWKGWCLVNSLWRSYSFEWILENFDRIWFKAFNNEIIVDNFCFDVNKLWSEFSKINLLSFLCSFLSRGLKVWLIRLDNIAKWSADIFWKIWFIDG